MAAERLFAGDPYNERHIELFEKFEEERQVKTKSLEYLKRIHTTIAKESYSDFKKNRNEIEDCLFLEKNGLITDCCYIEGEKDRKVCNLTFVKLSKTKKRKLLSLSVDYTFQTLGMEEVFVSISKEDSSLEKLLQEQGFESLGYESDTKIYLKEKEYYQESERVVK